jgi:hypothetical protein
MIDITAIVFILLCVGIYQVQKIITIIKHKKFNINLHNEQKRVYNIIK